MMPHQQPAHPPIRPSASGHPTRRVHEWSMLAVLATGLSVWWFGRVV